jgi:outer membrane protein TolC
VAARDLPGDAVHQIAGLTRSEGERSCLLALLATACATAPPQPVLDRGSTAVEPPDAWSVELGEAEPPSGPWWTTFADADLDRMIESALEENHDLRAAAAAVDAATARARIAGPDLAPQIGAGFKAARRQHIIVELPIPGREGPLQSKSDANDTSLNDSRDADLSGR